MKMNRDKVKGFMLGMLATVVFAGAGGTAIAASKGELLNIRVVQGGIKLFVDGKLSIPKDAQGKTVEPFIYDGTTYLPLRAVSDILTNSTKPVKWDSTSSSIYIGQAPMAAQTDLAELPVYEENSSGMIYTGEYAQFKLLEKTVSPFNFVGQYLYNGRTYQSKLVYILNSQYSSLDATLTVPYTNLNSTDLGSATFYSVNKQGEETQIAYFETKAGADVVPVHVDLRGVEILKIDISSNVKEATGTQHSNKGALYNITLSGIK